MVSACDRNHFALPEREWSKLRLGKEFWSWLCPDHQNQDGFQNVRSRDSLCWLHLTLGARRRFDLEGQLG